MWTDAALENLVDEGTYRLTFRSPIAPKIAAPDSYSLGDYLFTLESFTPEPIPDSILTRYYAVVRVRRNHGASGTWDANVGTGPEGLGGSTQVLPLIPILAGVAALIGLAAAYMILDKVERLVENPAVTYGIYVLGIIALVVLYKQLKK